MQGEVKQELIVLVLSLVELQGPTTGQNPVCEASLKTSGKAQIKAVIQNSVEFSRVGQWSSCALHPGCLYSPYSLPNCDKCAQEKIWIQKGIMHKWKNTMSFYEESLVIYLPLVRRALLPPCSEVSLFHFMGTP